MNTQNRFGRKLALASAFVILPAAAMAAECPADFPSKPVKFMVAYGAGGGTDAIARTLATEIEATEGWTISVDNKPGAGGDVMMTSMMSSDADGYTVGVSSTNTVTLDPYANEGVAFTWESFDYPGTAMAVTFGLVALADKPYSTLEEFIEFARENGRATVSTSAIAIEVAIQRIGEHFGVNLVPIPGDGAADALQSALGGHVDATVQGSQHIQQIEAGNMKQLSTLVAERVSYAPDTMTTIESGVDVTVGAYILFVLPKGVDAAIQTCLEQTLAEAAESEAYVALMTKFNTAPANLGVAGSLDFIKTQAADYKAIFEERNK